MATANVPIVTAPASTANDLDLSSIETATDRAAVTEIADKGDNTADIVYALVPMADGDMRRLRRLIKAKIQGLPAGDVKDILTAMAKHMLRGSI